MRYDLRHIATITRRGDGRWSKTITKWPRGGYRNVGLPTARWVDDIDKTVDHKWIRQHRIVLDGTKKRHMPSSGRGE